VVIKNMEVLVTATNSITAVGHTGEMTAASVRAGISRLAQSTDYFDIKGNPVTVARVQGITDDKDNTVSRVRNIAKHCLENLLERYFQDIQSSETEIHLLLGLPPLSRLGPKYEGCDQEAAKYLAGLVEKWTKNVTFRVIPSGNVSVIRCIDIARNFFKIKSCALCIVGGIDSLLARTTLERFEEAERLMSETYGRNQGFPPGEAVCFMVLDTREGALRRKKQALAEVVGVGLANEPAPFLSPQPSKGDGLTKACKCALFEAGCRPENIEVVLGDLDGEFFRSKQWGYAELRTFGNLNESRQLWHPADCLGSVGSASGAVLVNIAAVALSRGWIGRRAMVFCSDDEGECGATVLQSSTRSSPRK